MRKKLLCDLRIPVTIRAEGPILVKAGAEQLVGPDMVFVRTKRNGEEQPYLPGTSLKGVFRSYAERIIRTLAPAGGPPVCVPYAGRKDPETACGERLKNVDKPTAYKRSCPACRLFGSLAFAGRIAIRDAYLKSKDFDVEVRDGVAIDRHTGGVAGPAKFQLEVLTRGEFETVIGVDNFELWQVGLLVQLLADLSEGRIRVGMGASRGLGEVVGELGPATVRYVARNGSVRLEGIERLVGDEEAGLYGLFRSDAVTPSPLPGVRRDGFFDVCEMDGATFRKLAEPALQEFRLFVQRTGAGR